MQALNNIFAFISITRMVKVLFYSYNPLAALYKYSLLVGAIQTATRPMYVCPLEDKNILCCSFPFLLLKLKRYWPPQS